MSVKVNPFKVGAFVLAALALGVVALVVFGSGRMNVEEIVAKLESGDVALEESLDLYTEGMTLVKFCNQKLTVAREKIEKLSTKDSSDDSGNDA